MVSYSNLSKQGHGRLGNQLFQIASCIGIAEHFGVAPSFPDWEYEKYFENPLPKGNFGKPVKEKHFHFDFNQFSDDCDITGWLQSPKYFEHCSGKIWNQFKFKTDFEMKVISKIKFALGGCIAISIRRGDYVNNPNYVLLTPAYYIGALVKHFPNYKDYNIVIFSDDMDYCRVHFQSLDNVYYAEGSDIEQLCLMSLCDHFIIANSTFSFWGAWLGEKEHSKVIKPNYHFGYEFGKLNNAKDYYPERWLAYDHIENKIDLSDVTFIIPVSYDHTDRKENLDLVLKNLNENFDCKIIVGEQGGTKFDYVDCVHVKFDYEQFHRTKMLNVMTALAGTKIVINYDADVLLSPLQIIEAVNRLRKDVDFVYPYDGRFARVPRLFYDSVNSFNDVGALKGEDFKGTKDDDMRSYGGCVAYKRSSFIKAGGENENFISYSPEDVERVERFRKLGYKVERVNGILYHIDHHCGINSSQQNPFHEAGMKELKRIQKMKPEQLRKEVDSWVWANSMN